ncbi:DMT family transporter [Yoonia sp. BS5-3]|uniref:DMT family transporter n=1 Tax=Yoonia phaeophyticola TaxID=3137369 RepID=A0ABZ2VAK2_9RHOB
MAAILPREEKTAAGVILMIIAVALFICVDTSAKWLILGGMAPIQAAFARYAGHFVYAVLFFWPSEGRSVFSTARPFVQIARSLALLGSTVLNFFALSQLPITVTTTIMFSMPIIITVLAIPILGERVGLRRFSAVCVGFCGVIVVTQPWGAQWHPAMLYSLGAVSSAAIYFIMTRLLAGQASNATMQIWSSGIPTALLLPFATAQWVWPETALGWSVFLGIGMFGLISHMLATMAHRYAEAALLSPVVYCQILFAAVAGIVAFDTWPTVYTLLGGLIIIGSGLYIWLRERKLAAL